MEPRIYRMSPRAWPVCPACRETVHAKVSSRRLRFFAHDAANKDCPLTGETLDHRLLKSALAAAVRQCGWYATLEARADDGSWIADVLATSPDGARQIVWEAQLARQHDDDTRDRTVKYQAAGFEVVWVFDRLTAPPAPHITVDIQQRHIDVDRRIADLHTSQCPAKRRCIRYPKLIRPLACPGHATWEPATAGLDHFVTAVCRRQLHWLALPAVDAPIGRRPNPPQAYAWAHPADVTHAEDLRRAQLTADAVAAATAKAELDQQRQQEALRHQHEQEELARQQEEQRQRQEQLRRQWEQQQLDKREEQRRQREEQQRHAANTAALRKRQRLLTPTVVHRVTEQFGVTPSAMEEGDPELAMGISIIANSKPVAVVCPIASQITSKAADQLIAITIYVASEHERRNIARRCKPGQKIIILSAVPPRQ